MATRPQEKTLIIYPQEITPALEEVLRLMLWSTAPVAAALRADGQDVPTQAEAEQAVALHFLIPYAIQYGMEWRQKAGADLSAMVERANAKGPLN